MCAMSLLALEGEEEGEIYFCLCEWRCSSSRDFPLTHTHRASEKGPIVPPLLSDKTFNNKCEKEEEETEEERKRSEGEGRLKVE